MNIKNHIVFNQMQKSIFVDRELGLKMLKRSALAKLEEVIGIGDKATVLFEVKPLPLYIGERFYPEELQGRRADGQFVVKGNFVTREEWLEEYNRNCFILRCHVVVEDIKNEIPSETECSEFLPYEES